MKGDKDRVRDRDNRSVGTAACRQAAVLNGEGCSFDQRRAQPRILSCRRRSLLRSLALAMVVWANLGPRGEMGSRGKPFMSTQGQVASDVRRLTPGIAPRAPRWWREPLHQGRRLKNVGGSESRAGTAALAFFRPVISLFIQPEILHMDRGVGWV